jgi:hypothetical protein
VSRGVGSGKWEKRVEKKAFTFLMSLKASLDSVSFQELVDIQSTVGIEKFNSVYHSKEVNDSEVDSNSEVDSEVDSSSLPEIDHKQSPSVKPVKKSKHAPVEISSKKQISRKRSIVDSLKPVLNILY